MQQRALMVLFILIWALTGAHLAAEYCHLYWVYRWLDVPMHFVGGVWVGLMSLFVYDSMATRRGHVHPLVIGFIGGLSIGLVWEFYEFVVWQFSGRGLPGNYIEDTLLDVLMDVVGALSASVPHYFLTKKENALEGVSH